MKEINCVNIVGLGYVGLPLALLSAKKYKTVGIDTNKERVAKINAKQSPFLDNRAANELADTTLIATTNFSVIKDAQVIVICVPTPVHEDYQPNLEPVIKACENIGQYLTKGQLVILESTVNPGVCEDIVLPVLERTSGLEAGKDFYLAHCPERINPGDTNWNVANIPRVVGSLESKGLEIALEFYRSLIGAQIKPMGSLKEAEAVKVVENSFRDVNIAFVNELAMSFTKLGIDVVNVIEGAASKPFAFMPHFPGCGVGGHCIPVDPYYLIEYARQNGFQHDFLSLARKINNQMPKFTVDLLISKLAEKNIPLLGTKVSLLGLAYKPDLDDDRESPAYKVLEQLQAHGFVVSAYDPYIVKGSEKSIEEALEGAKAVIITTSHNIFKNLKPEDLSKYGVEVVIDGRNCLDKQSFAQNGIAYQGIGR
ncbi:MAG TPA: nucleotide sugar dehydrogenase [Patescibacteria group bacterium]|nr:nucleotide sugar dehydrogenase [Patescibacteria group bacterium]